MNKPNLFLVTILSQAFRKKKGRLFELSCSKPVRIIKVKILMVFGITV
jgi:hypothetical protein